MSRVRILAVCSFTPLPISGGDSVRVLGIMKALSVRADLTIWCVDSHGSDSKLLAQELPHAQIRQFERSRKQNTSKMANLIRYAEGFTLGVPSWILKRRSAKLVDALRGDGDSWDSVIALGEASAQYFTESSPRRWHWDKFNVQSISLRDEFTWSNGFAAGIRDLITLHATLRFEQRFARRATSVSATNKDEAKRYRSISGSEALVLHSTVTVAAIPLRNPEPGRILWLGSFGYRSNVDGLSKFLESSWPKLKNYYRLRVVGSAMDDSVREWLSSQPGVEPVGYVSDLAAEMAYAQIGIVPIWTGGGTKMKTLTMLANGLPVVSTVAGIEGISATHGREVYVASEPQDFATAIERAATDRHAEALGERGRQLVVSNFTEEGIAEQYDNLMRAIVNPQRLR